jgi:hypothetical protein
MPESTMIDDVRAAKKWVDAQSSDFEEMDARLLEVEQAWKDRAGVFSNVPRERPAWVQAEIAAAADEQGREPLNETRAGG